METNQTAINQEQAIMTKKPWMKQDKSLAYVLGCKLQPWSLIGQYQCISVTVTGEFTRKPHVRHPDSSHFTAMDVYI